MPTSQQRPRRSIATVCLAGTLEEKLAAAADAGFDGVEIFENDLIASALSPAQVRTEAAGLGLTIELYQPFRDAEGIPDGRWADVVRRAECKFEVMSQLGTRTMLICSSVAPDTIDDDARAADQLAELADRASSYGLRIAYEALAWGRHVSTWVHSWRIVEAAAHPALGICLDSFHILSRAADARGIDELPGDRIFFLQLADAPRLDMDVLQWSRHHRLFPGQGAFDLVSFTAAVLSAGYTGPLSLEVFNDQFRQSDPRPAAVDAMRSLLDLEEGIGERFPQLGSSSAPPAPHLLGHAFVELAVDGPSGQDMARTLAALGFTHTGQHRSKPVQLWEQNGARIVVNAGTSRASASRVPAIGAVGLAATDPAAAQTRAVTMLAPAVEQHREPGESDLYSVRAPDGTEVLFCPAAERDEPWRADFLDTGSVDEGGVGLQHIDHIALPQAFDHYYEAGLFFRTVLGLRHTEAGELAAPFGLIRTLVESDDATGIRIALSSSLVRRGEWGPDVRDPQHVAFATADLLQTMDRLLDRGARLLSIPHNYYEDLSARTHLSDERLRAMESRGVLYDRDASGEFLHAYTILLGDHFFFEMVQRIGGYSGYGALNSPIRMAAHRQARLHHHQITA